MTYCSVLTSLVSHPDELRQCYYVIRMRYASFLKSSGWDSKFRFFRTRGGPSALPLDAALALDSKENECPEARRQMMGVPRCKDHLNRDYGYMNVGRLIEELSRSNLESQHKKALCVILYEIIDGSVAVASSPIPTRQHKNLIRCHEQSWRLNMEKDFLINYM